MDSILIEGIYQNSRYANNSLLTDFRNDNGHILTILSTAKWFAAY